MAFCSASRLTLCRFCFVCRICVWPWKDEQCTWPFPYPPADTHTCTRPHRRKKHFKEHQQAQHLLEAHLLKIIPPYADATFHLLGCVCVWIPRAPADTTLTMWKLMVSSLLVISTVMADLLCAMVPMSFHLLHAWKYIQKKEWWKKGKHILPLGFCAFKPVAWLSERWVLNQCKICKKKKVGGH